MDMRLQSVDDILVVQQYDTTQTIGASHAKSQVRQADITIVTA